jgi:hypothetical protein
MATGDTLVRVRLVDSSEERPPIFESETVVRFLNPLFPVVIVFPQSNVVFPEEGQYTVQLFGAGEFLQEHRLEVRLYPEEDSGEPDDSD